MTPRVGRPKPRKKKKKQAKRRRRKPPSNRTTHAKRGRARTTKKRKSSRKTKKRMAHKTKTLNQLTIVQLKKIFIRNSRVSYAECCCKKDYISLAIKLWRKKLTSSSQQHVIGICEDCLAVKKMCIFLDCWHMFTCIECAEEFENCPFCKAPVRDILEVFVP